MAQGTTRGVPIDTDGTLSNNSDLLVPSQKAVKTYVTANSVSFASLSANSPLSYNNAGVFSISQATTSTNGYLSSTDFTTFNNKQNALTNPVTGTGTTNELSYFTGTSTIGSLSTTTYPSLTELSYVKGVTSSLQTQINGKQSSLTFSTGLTNTAGTITSNLSVGVSGGQSVIGGTAASNSLTLSSTSNATKGKILFGTSAYDEVNNRLGIGTSSPTTALDLSGKLNIAYSASTTDYPVVIKNTDSTVTQSNVLSFDCSATGVDQPVFVNFASSTPKGMAFFASNQAITSSPVAAGFQIYSTSSTNFPGHIYFDSGANNSASIMFRTAQTAGTITQRMRIFANGNIQVGSTSSDAGYKLDVTGTGRYTGSLLTAGKKQAFSAKSANYSMTSTDEMISVDASGGARTITLPTAGAIAGCTYTIKKIDSSANAVTIATTSSQTIDASTTYSLASQWKYVTVVSNGSNWLIIANN